jgi:hypothetical protein
MRVLQCIAALALSATVAACGGSRVQNLANKCAAYGYQPGTLEFSQCIEREDERGRQATGAALGTMQRQQQLNQQPYQQLQPWRPPSMAHCQTYALSNTPSTNCPGY